MTKAGLGKSAEARIGYWRARIAEQERSGMSVGRFCQEQQITEQSFYVWRKRLRQPEPVRFALVESGAAPTETAAEPALELVLKTGERLRIGRGVDEAALRTVLTVLRA
jgi:transposase-like protein